MSIPVRLMYPLIKKITTALLLAILLAPLTYSYIFQAKQADVQRRMKKQLQGNMLHSLVLAKEDLHWVKPGKEIMVGEKMFDIKTIDFRNDGMVHITGLFDHEETFLYAQLNKNRKEETNRNNQQLIHLFQVMQALPEQQPEPVCFSNPLAQAHLLSSQDHLPSPFRSILTPPPQL